MAEKICLDTDVCIAILNGEERAEKFLNNSSSSEIYSTFNQKHFLRMPNLKLLTTK